MKYMVFLEARSEIRATSQMQIINQVSSNAPVILFRNVCLTMRMNIINLSHKSLN